MRKILIFIFFVFSLNVLGQEPTWDQGVPFFPENEYINTLTSKINLDKLKDNQKISDKEASICRDIGLAFYDLGFSAEADFYLKKSKDFHFQQQSSKLQENEEVKLSSEELKSMQNDLKFLEDLPKNFDKVSPKDLKNLAKQIESQIQKLLLEKDSLLRSINPNKKVIEAKENTITSLKKDKEIIGLTLETKDLKTETKGLKIKTLGLEIEKESLKKYLWISGIILVILILGILVLFQRKTIKVQDSEIENQLMDITKKNTFLEHAARIIRHDMHSGINTYIPRGITSLEKRINDDEAKKLKIDLAIKMIKEGLLHTQKVYKKVYEFTNLVKQNVVLDKKNFNLKDLLDTYLTNTSFKSQVIIDDLINIEVNEILFCNAIDNLIRNGLQYNDNEDKKIHIYMENNYLIVEDNGRGMTEKKLEKILNSKLDENKEGGLGLNICFAILKEHGFGLSCEKEKNGTKMKIKLT